MLRFGDHAGRRRGVLAAGAGFAQRRTIGAGAWFDRAIVIDGLGGTDDPYGDDGVIRMSERAWRETVATGVTVVRDTVLPVGNVSRRLGRISKGHCQQACSIGANPDRLLLVRSAADILKAKREGKFGVVSAPRTRRWSGPSSTGWRK